MGAGECAFQWAGGRDGDLDAPHAHRDERAKLQEFEPDGSCCGVSQFCSLQGYAAESGHEHIGKRGEPQPQLVGAQVPRRGPVCEEVELAFLDAVFHVAAGTVDFFVKLFCFKGLA